MSGEVLLKKIVEKDWESLTIDELRVVIECDRIFSLSKKDKNVLIKTIDDNDVDKHSDKIIEILKEGLPSTFVILSNLDKQNINSSGIEIDLRKSLINNLNKMNHLQLCTFIDKVLLVSEEFKIRFFRNEEYSLHEINYVISRSLGLTLVFEIFKKGKYKTFKDISYNLIDKKYMVETLNNHLVRYLYILKTISDIVLSTEEDKLTGTKINKNIREQISDYVKIIKQEREKVRKTGVISKQTWTYAVCGLKDISMEDDDEFFDWGE